MRRGLAVTGTLLLSACLVLAAAVPASAAVRGRIISVEAKDGQLQLVFSAAGLNEGDRIDPASVRLTLAGEPLKATVAGAGGSGAPTVLRRVILALDTSGSMNLNDRIGSARAAALAYLAKVPGDVQVGLVAFSTTARSLVAPTTDRAAVRTAVAGLQATGDTALYDAVALAARQLGDKGDRSVLVLSDGKDEGSKTTLAADVALLRKAKIPLNAVVFGDVSAQPALNSLSSAAGGRVVTARAAADLTRTFEQAARAADHDIVVTAEIPASYAGGEASVAVSATAAGQVISDSALAINLVAAQGRPSSDFGPQAVEPISGAFAQKTVLYGGLLALFLGLGTVLAFALTGATRADTSMGGRLRPFVDTRGAPRKGARESRSLREAAVGVADDLVRNQNLEAALARRLDSGGIPLKPAEWLILHMGLALLLPLFVLLVSNVNIGLTVIALAVGTLGPLGYLTVKASMRTRKFLAQLPDTLQLLSGSLSSGYSLPQALDAVVRQGAPPMSDELRKALVEARLGAPVEDALDDVADRMASKDFSWVVMAIRIQRQVGGNLAEVLATTAATLRERERLRRQVQVLSAEGRLSAYILFGLPVFFSLYLIAVRPAYLKPLVTDPIGWVLLGGMAILLTVGAFWLRKVVKVEV